MFLIADNKETQEKIYEMQDDCDYDTEEEEETEIVLDKTRFEDFEELFQLQSVEGEVVYACNVCDEGLDTEDDVKKHINIHHKEIIRTISIESEDLLQNPDQGKIVYNKSNSNEEKVKAKHSYTCQACVVYGNAKFVSSNDKEINDHILNHLEVSRKKSKLKEKKKKEERRT